jgi:hypothetical protein
LFVAMSAVAQADASAGTCIDSYIVAQEFRAKIRTLEADKNAVPFHGLAAYADGFDTIEFEKRARDVDARAPDANGSKTRAMDAFLSSSDKVEALVGEVPGARLLALTATPAKIYEGQRALLTTLRACDVAFGFKPQLGAVPSADKVAAALKGAVEKNSQAKADRLAALDDRACSIRFELVSNLYPAGSPGRDLNHRRAQAAAAKALSALPNMPRERFVEQWSQDLLVRAEKYKSGDYTLSEIIEDLNACERRYQMPVSDLRAN